MHEYIHESLLYLKGNVNDFFSRLPSSEVYVLIPTTVLTQWMADARSLVPLVANTIKLGEEIHLWFIGHLVLFGTLQVFFGRCSKECMRSNQKKRIIIVEKENLSLRGPSDASVMATVHLAKNRILVFDEKLT